MIEAIDWPVPIALAGYIQLVSATTWWGRRKLAESTSLHCIGIVILRLETSGAVWVC